MKNILNLYHLLRHLGHWSWVVPLIHEVEATQKAVRTAPAGAVLPFVSVGHAPLFDRDCSLTLGITVTK